ncbi:MAG: dephospho-CoA kinase [Ruminococcaceae bacterium]|nr:dephospho-CoA kinase [Oscillospiraceae bacterium]
MKTIGLTGQSGAGKGAFSKALSLLGIPCLDTDVTARQVVEKGKPCLLELVDRFGKDILLPDGTLDRKKLGTIAFSDKEKLSALNSITHRYIALEVDEWLEEQKDNGAFAAVIDAPQLFESGIDSICDLTVAILADENTRFRRILSRDSISEEYAKKRMASQKDDEFFISHCDHIIYNNGDEAELFEKAKTFVYDHLTNEEHK